MMPTLTLSLPEDKILFTPGPLTTSLTVKRAMLRDLGSRDTEFIGIVRNIRQRLLELGGVRPGDYEAILMQGSGTFAVESVISSVIPPDGKLLVIVNGAYGRRIEQMARVLKIASVELTFPENQTPVLSEIEAVLTGDQAITHVAVIHCETTTGLINPIKPIGLLAQKYGKR